MMMVRIQNMIIMILLLMMQINMLIIILIIMGIIILIRVTIIPINKPLDRILKMIVLKTNNKTQ